MKNLLLVITLLSFSCSEKSFSQFTLSNAFPNLIFTNPLDLQNAGDGSNRIFVVEQAGIIYVFENNRDVTVKKKFLDISDSVSSGGEMGLLGLAFHPDYKNNGYFFVNYTKASPYRRTLIVRFKVSSTNPDSADRSSSKILMEIPQPYSNHNGGQVSFGPDGFLYIALGDGGSGGDPQNNAQNKSSLLGKLLRIDVNQTQGQLNYAIPADNPFAGNMQGYKEEIYAFGLRNPWRFSFDFHTGKLWCADVGQNAWEEIDLITKGGNYGWRCYEGTHNYDLSGCNDPNYIPPIYEYSHQEGSSITGGFVYRGYQIPEIYGKYIYADYVSRKTWALSYDSLNPVENLLLATAQGGISSFGIDENNELYICSFNGRIYRINSASAIEAPNNLRITSSNASSIEIAWSDNSNNESGFKIERKIGSANFEIIDSVGANITSFVDNSIQSTAAYSYRIFAYNAYSISGYSNVVSVLVSSSDESYNYPEKFRLNQNFPNPFNSTTKIRYSVPPLISNESKNHNVTLKVYDILGKELITLVNEFLSPGIYEIEFDTSRILSSTNLTLPFTSGVLFYSLKADSFIDTKKMILLR